MKRTCLSLPGEQLAGAVGKGDQQRARVARQVIGVGARLHAQEPQGSVSGLPGTAPGSGTCRTAGSRPRLTSSGNMRRWAAAWHLHIGILDLQNMRRYCERSGRLARLLQGYAVLEVEVAAAQGRGAALQCPTQRQRMLLGPVQAVHVQHVVVRLRRTPPVSGGNAGAVQQERSPTPGVHPTLATLRAKCLTSGRL